MDFDLPDAPVPGTDSKDPNGHCVHTSRGTSLTLVSVDQTSRKRLESGALFERW